MPSNAKSTLRPDSRFAFRRHVRQTHRTHRTQGIIFADARSTPNGRWLIRMAGEHLEETQRVYYVTMNGLNVSMHSLDDRQTKV